MQDTIDTILPREHQEEDDAKFEKQARDIVEGKKRVKRRGFDLGSDESGSDDEDADRRRRKSIKKPRFDDGKLEGIGSSIIIATFDPVPSDTLPTGGDVDPSAFLRAYNSNLEDTEVLFPVDEDSQMAERDDDDDDDEDEDDDGEPRETISTRDIEAQVRKAAREKVPSVLNFRSAQQWMATDLAALQKYDDVGSFDPSDTRFMDGDSDDDEPPLRTREVEKKAPKLTRTRDAVDPMVRFHPYVPHPGD